MSKFSGLLARKAVSFADRVPILLGRSGHAGEDGLKEFDSALFAEGGSRMGAENEALRGLVIDTARKFGELNDIKLSFSRIIEPLHKSLQALEQEKSQNASLTGALNESRAQAETLRAELQESEKGAAALTAAQEKLSDELELARQSISNLENIRIELGNDVTLKTAEIADLQSRLAAENNARQALAEEHRIATEQMHAASKRLVQFDTEVIAARQKIALLEDDSQTLQSSLDQTLSEVSRLSRQLADTGNTLAATQARLAQVEAMHADVEAERTRVIAEFDEAKEKHRAESNALAMRADALQSRASTAEKLLVEARSNLAARAQEIRAFDRKVVEATVTQNALEKKLNQIEVSAQIQERQVRDLEQARGALVERNAALTNTVRAREMALARAEEKVQSSAEFIARLEADIQASRSRAEKRIEEMNSTMERERMDRALAEGALEATRKDNARLQNEIAMLEASLRRGPSAVEEEPASAPQARRHRNGQKGSVQPIVKA